MTIEERVIRLERTNRLQGMALIGAIAVVAVMGFGGSGIQEEVRTRRLELVNTKGEKVAVLVPVTRSIHGPTTGSMLMMGDLDDVTGRRMTLVAERHQCEILLSPSAAELSGGVRLEVDSTNASSIELIGSKGLAGPITRISESGIETEK